MHRPAEAASPKRFVSIYAVDAEPRRLVDDLHRTRLYSAKYSASVFSHRCQTVQRPISVS